MDWSNGWRRLDEPACRALHPAAVMAPQLGRNTEKGSGRENQALPPLDPDKWLAWLWRATAAPGRPFTAREWWLAYHASALTATESRRELVSLAAHMRKWRRAASMNRGG